MNTTAETKPKCTRKSFSLEEKLKIIKNFDNSNLSQHQFAASSGIHPSSLRSILKKRKDIDEILALKGVKRKKMRMRSGKYNHLEKILVKWYNQAKSLEMPINGPILQSKAREIADLLHINDFSCSTGWLDRFKKRFDITYARITNEKETIQIDVMSNWQNNVIKQLMQRYERRNIYGSCEFGIFYKLMPDQARDYHGENCVSGNLSDERITVLICTNIDGTDKLKPLIVGNSRNPPCFANIKSLPCQYFADDHSVLTADIVSNWFQNWNEKLRSENRYIALLSIKSKSFSQSIELSNISLAVIPPNLVEEDCPFNYGLVKILKRSYRMHIVRHYLRMKTEDPLISKQVSVADALRFLCTSWDKIDKEVIFNCFRKTCFKTEEKIDEVLLEEVHRDYTWEHLQEQASLCGLPNLKEYLSVDDNLITRQTEILDPIVEVDLKKEIKEEVCEDYLYLSVEDNLITRQAEILDPIVEVDLKKEIKEELCEDSVSAPTLDEAVDALDTIRNYFNSLPDVSDTVFRQLNAISDSLVATASVTLSKIKIEDSCE